MTAMKAVPITLQKKRKENDTGAIHVVAYVNTSTSFTYNVFKRWHRWNH